MTNRFDFEKLQFEKAIDTFLNQYNLLIQIITALTIADITLLGFAINSKIASLWLIGFIFPFAILMIVRTIKRLMVPVVYTAIIIESKHENLHNDWLSSTFISYLNNKKLVEKFIVISKMELQSNRIKELSKIKSLGFKHTSGLFIFGLVIITIGHIILPIILIIYFHWSFL